MNIETILTHYLICALWASMDDAGEPLDRDFYRDDIAPESIATAREEITGFLAGCEAAGLDLSELSESQIGHDLWLTRNHHGAGFWDRGLGDLGEKLTEHAEALGESDAYIGNDGKVYLS